MRKLILLLCVLMLLWAAVAMATNTATPRMPLVNYGHPADANDSALFTQLNYQAADMLQGIMQTRVNRKAPILVASMVSLNDFAETSTLGRLVMQQVGSRISQYGYAVVESRIGRDMIMKVRDGEFLLTRDIARAMQVQFNAQAALVGSYVHTKDTVFLSLRLLRLDDSSVVAAYDYELPYKGVVKHLLKEAPVNVLGTWAMYAARPPAFTGGQTLFSLPPQPAGQSGAGTGQFGNGTPVGPPTRVDR